MSGNEIILIIAATFLFCAITFGLGALLWRYLAERGRRERERDELLRKLVPALEAFAAAVVPFSILPKMLDGLTKVCAAQVAEITKFREATQVIAGILGQKPPKDEFTAPTEEDAYRAGRKQEYLIRGLSPEEAETQMEVDEQQKIYGGGDPSVLNSMMET
jgi:hypothetical protein